MQSLFQELEDKNEPENAHQLSVLIPLPVDKAYSYAVPAGLDLKTGDYVTVPLGSREVPAVVWGESSENVPSKKLKTIVARYDFPSMPEVQRKFIDWVAHYNMAPLGFVMKMSLSVPAALEPPRSVTGYRVSGWVEEIVSSVTPPLPASPLCDGGGVKSPPLKRGEVWRGARDKARDLRKDMTEAEKKLWFELNREQLGVKFRKQHPIAPYITDFACLEKSLIIELDGGQHDDQRDYDDERTKHLESKGFKVLRFWNNEVLENIEGVIFKIDEALKLNEPSEKEKFLQNLSPQQRRILALLSDGLPRRAAEIADQAACSSSVVKTMMNKNILEAVKVYSSAPCRKPNVGKNSVVLSEYQQTAADELTRYVDDGAYQAVLLDGVTGSGKTEVYFEAVVAALKQGKQVLILLPEIALSNAFLDRFKSRFGCAPALWHSHLSKGQRKTTWRGVAEGQTKVVVGARSALFLPFADLGLIILDEEHDPAYKQEDGVIYHARDMAIVRAHMGKIPVVLVSATPSLETMMNVWQERYSVLELPDRHGGARLPDMHIIDMKQDKPARQHFISPTLKDKLVQNLERHEQSLLFLNRRGYAPLTLCRSCGHRMNCPRCTSWLVEHKKNNRLSCHHCGYFMPVPKQCPECNDEHSFAACGPGVERIFEEVSEYFPEARIIVLASDTAEDHGKLRDILNDIRDHKYDIIIGTQIIAKGHHFPKLTLVGVIDADLGLAGGDLRASERTYQLLHQVAGRAGREDLPGNVYLQTFLPDNKVMQALAGHKRDVFLNVEAAEREAANMPPYTRLVGIVVSGKNENLVTDTAKALGRLAPQGKGIQTLGPAEAPFYRLRGNYRRRLLVRADKVLNIQQVVADWLAQVKTPSTIRIYVDIDPQSFL